MALLPASRIMFFSAFTTLQDDPIADRLLVRLRLTGPVLLQPEPLLHQEPKAMSEVAQKMLWRDNECGAKRPKEWSGAMPSRLSMVTFAAPVNPVNIKPASRFDLMLQLAAAAMQIRKLSADNEQLRNAKQQLQEQLQSKDAELQQQQQRLAIHQQQLEQQIIETCDLRQRGKQQSVLEQLQQFEHDASSKEAMAPAAEAATRPAGCSPEPVIPSAHVPAADGATHGKSVVLPEPADSVEPPKAPSPVDCRAECSPRSSDSASSSDDGCSSNGSSMPHGPTEQTAPAASSWWWWRATDTSNTTTSKTPSITINNSTEPTTASLGKTNIFSSWWVMEPAVNIAAGAASDMLYI